MLRAVVLVDLPKLERPREPAFVAEQLVQLSGEMYGRNGVKMTFRLSTSAQCHVEDGRRPLAVGL